MANHNPYNIQIKHYFLGEDITFHITGGKAHIGGMATAYWNKDKIEVKMLELPHHKEGELAEECAKLATYSLGITTTVVMGIHIDHATKEQISEIVALVKEKMKSHIDSIK